MITMAASDPYGYGAADLRTEEPGWTLGEIVKPGMLIAAGPHHCEYLVECIGAADRHYDGIPCWSLTGWYAPGGIAERSENRRWWLNGWVAQRYAGAPHGILLRPLGIYRYDCPARDSLFLIVADQAFAARRSGQLEMFA